MCEAQIDPWHQNPQKPCPEKKWNSANMGDGYGNLISSWFGDFD